MPIWEFAGDSSWGYNGSHPFALESSYGTPNQLKRFVDEAHERGMAVLVDVLYNHWGSWRYVGLAIRWLERKWIGWYFPFTTTGVLKHLGAIRVLITVGTKCANIFVTTRCTG